MVLFFHAENAVGNIVADNDTERQLRAPWDNFLECVLQHFFAYDTPGTVPVRGTMVDAAEGRFRFK